MWHSPTMPYEVIERSIENGCGRAALGYATYVPIGLTAVVSLTRGVIRDSKHGSTRNTAEAAVGSACGLAGGLGGAALGAKIGTMVCPGVGTAVGAATGSAFGALGFELGGRKAASAVFDDWDYDIKIFRCKECNRRFKCRIYTDQSRRYCLKCDEDAAMSC